MIQITVSAASTNDPGEHDHSHVIIKLNLCISCHESIYCMWRLIVPHVPCLVCLHNYLLFFILFVHLRSLGN